ncbi:zinc finger protein 676-like [Belonocnema kinseyi]|uniref:zinc finger protein 676-like n=1 Tax=Belonocnema kinseyi TaxID=2817044 RepID=UPI00143E08A1|nr:zinc finger protein 676-like [Belonocnema kinseyi]
MANRKFQIDKQIKSESTKSTEIQDVGTFSWTNISSGNKSDVKTFIKYEIDETLEIKEESVQDVEKITDNKHDQAYDSTFCTVDIIRKYEISAVKRKLRNLEKHEFEKSEQEMPYTCEKCGRSYSKIKVLKSHQKFECDVMPQFCCKFCTRLFKRKYDMDGHIHRVHHKTDIKKAALMHNCDKCPRSYKSVRTLARHKNAIHAAIIPQFICDVCGYKVNTKDNLVKHMISRHLQTSESRHKCDKCPRSYVWPAHLTRHKRLVHTEDKPQFICDFCGYKTNRKCALVTHIISRHSKTSKSRHNCDQCWRSYRSLVGLNRHKVLKHATSIPQFTCNVCDYKSKNKCNLLAHITSHHSRT